MISEHFPPKKQLDIGKTNTSSVGRYQSCMTRHQRRTRKNCDKTGVTERAKWNIKVVWRLYCDWDDGSLILQQLKSSELENELKSLHGPT